LVLRIPDFRFGANPSIVRRTNVSMSKAFCYPFVSVCTSSIPVNCGNKLHTRYGTLQVAEKNVEHEISIDHGRRKGNPGH
jgi:hypothetical protein